MNHMWYLNKLMFGIYIIINVIPHDGQIWVQSTICRIVTIAQIFQTAFQIPSHVGWNFQSGACSTCAAGRHVLKQGISGVLMKLGSWHPTFSLSITWPSQTSIWHKASFASHILYSNPCIRFYWCAFVWF